MCCIHVGAKFKKDIDKLELVMKGKKEKEGSNFLKNPKTAFFKEWSKDNKAI